MRDGYHPRFYEPWLPQVGDIVRVRKGEECPVQHLRETDEKLRRVFPHIFTSDFAGQPCQPAWADGQTAEVVSVSRYPAPDDDGTDVDDGHDFYCNDSGDCGHWHSVDDFFAAIELDLVSRPIALGVEQP